MVTMSTNSQTISILNALIETLKDGQQGFKAAAESVQADDLRRLFDSYSLQRSKFAGELQALANSLGEHEPETSGSLSGAIHRGWVNLKSALTAQDDHAVLAECERGEDTAVAEYKKALETRELPSNIRATVAAQSEEIHSAHNRVRDLRDALVTK